MKPILFSHFTIISHEISFQNFLKITKIHGMAVTFTHSGYKIRSGSL